MCDPITLSLLVGGAAMSAGGGIWGRNDALNNAQREANARNGILSGAIGNLGQIYSNTNAPAFSGAVGAIDPANLGKAQTSRTAAITGNLPGAEIAGAPATPSDAPPALAGDRRAALRDAFSNVTGQAKATGNLGGYGDQWFNSNLAAQDAGRKIGVGNSLANETKSLIGPEQDLAAAAAYKTPSPWPGLLKGIGGLMGAAGGNPTGLRGIFGPRTAAADGGTPDTTGGIFT